MNLRPAYTLLLIILGITGIIYPLFMTLIGQALMNRSANGSQVIINGKVKGSELIGQYFSDPRYFWGRPSATSPAPYNAAASSGSNYGQLNPEFIEKVKVRVEELKKDGANSKIPIPIDLVTSSASGLDPHISILSAQYQIPRVAKARGIPEETVAKIVQDQTYSPILGFIGEPRVNVLLLNLALDNQSRN